MSVDYSTHPTANLPDQLLTTHLALSVLRPKDAPDLTELVNRDREHIEKWSRIAMGTPATETEVLERHIQPRVVSREGSGLEHATAYVVRSRRSGELLGSAEVKNCGDGNHEVGFWFATRADGQTAREAVGVVVYTLAHDPAVRGIFAREDATDAVRVEVWNQLGFDEVFRSTATDELFSYDGATFPSGTAVMLSLVSREAIPQDVRPVTKGPHRGSSGLGIGPSGDSGE